MSAAPKMQHLQVSPERVATAESAMHERARLRIDLTLTAVQGLCAADRWAEAPAERIAARAVRIADATETELNRVEGRRHASR